MSVLARAVRRPWARPTGRDVGPVPARPTCAELLPIHLASDDPLLAYAATVDGTIDVDELSLASPGLASLRAAGVKLVVPLMSQGELVGLLNLGPRLGDRAYSHDDQQLLAELAMHAAPAIRVAQLVREHEVEAVQRERMKQELRVAQLIQHRYLPDDLPQLPGWEVAAYYQPAWEVGGDFYDFFALPHGGLGMVVGDVTDKGIPAALVMATTHSLLRAEGPRLVDPGKVLARVNELLVAEMPPGMFVTCLYAVLDPATGRLRLANAGHNLPLVAGDAGVCELDARGMPLGLMPAMTYEEMECTLAPGDRMLLHSDGLTEAHDADRAMFGLPRLRSLADRPSTGKQLIDELLEALRDFTGPTWEQEDDITLVTVARTGDSQPMDSGPDGDRLLAGFSIASEVGNERVVRDRVAETVAGLGLSPRVLERLGTAVAEAALNAVEHGNGGRADVPVDVEVWVSAGVLRVLVSDQGGGPGATPPPAPDLAAKLAGEQTPRGWGLFLINHMVDEVASHTDDHGHTLELRVDLRRNHDADPDHADT